MISKSSMYNSRYIAFFQALLLIGYILFSMFIGRNITNRYAPLITASKEIKFEATTAHLWLEETITGDQTNSLDDIWKRLDMAKWYLMAMLEGGENSQGKYVPLNDLVLRKTIESALCDVIELRAMAQQRCETPSLAGIGSEIDQHHDAVFENFIISVEQVENGLLQVMNEQIRLYHNLQITFIIVILIFAVIFSRISQGHTRRLTEALHETESSKLFNESLLNTNPNIIYIYDISEQKNIYSNKGIATVLGYTQAEVIKMGDNLISSLMHPDDLVIYLRDTAPRYHSAADGELIEHDYRMKHKNGELRYFHAKEIIYQRREDGTPVQVFGVSSDNTDRRQTEEKLQISENNFRLLAEFTNDWEYWLNPDGNYIYNSPSCKIITGYSAKEYTEDPNIFLKLIHEDYRERLTYHYQEENNANHPEYMTEFPIKHKDGSERWIEHRCRPVFDRDGGYLGQRGNNRNITKRKQAEIALLESRERFKKLSELTFEGILFHEKGVAIDLNESLPKMFGYTREELIGANLMELLVPVEYHSTVLANLNKSIAPPYEVEGRRKNGELFPVEIESMDIGNKNEKFRAAALRDISERKRVESIFNKQKHLLEKAQSLGSLGSWEYDLRKNTVFWTDETCRIFGVPSGTVANYEIFVDKVHPDDREFVKSEWIEALKGGLYDIEHRLLINGETKWVRQKADIEYDESGVAVQATGFTQDITVNRQIEIDNSENLKQLNSVFRVAPIGIGVVIDRKFKFVNKRFIEMIGYTEEELVGSSSRLIYDNDEEYDRVGKDKYDQIQEHGIGTVETVMLRKDGTLIDVLLSSTPMNLLDLSEGVTFTALDITKRKMGEERIAKYNRIFEDSVSEIFLFDEKNIKFLEVNSAGQKNLGYSLEELKKMTPVDMYPEISGELFEDLIEPLRNGYDKEIVFETVHKRKNGSHYNVEVKLQVIKHNGKKVFTSIVSDITKQIQQKNERLQLESQLRQSQKLETIGTMVGGISHEFNNVLQSMFLYTGLIRDELPDEGELRANLQHLLNDGERARDLVNQILTFSHKSEIRYKAQSIHGIILDALSFGRASFSPDIIIEQDIRVDSGSILCDKTQIQQIVINLCNNAQHAMEEKGGKLRVSLKQVQATLGVGDSKTALLELVIGDTGKGMSKEIMDRIFDPFYTTKDIGEGTGLGLSVIYGIVEAMRGQISVSSEPGKGSTFRLLFPIVESVAEINKSDSGLQPEIKHKAVLLVDDEDSIRIVTQKSLTRKGYTVDTASGGVEALALFKTNSDKYDLIVTDLSMPEMSGLEFTDHIRKTGSEIPILLSTGHLGADKEVKYKNAGISGFIQKPWTVNELIERIGKLEFPKL